MKKLNFKLLAAFVGALMLVFISSCKKDEEPTPVDHTPVLNNNFSFTVTGNNVVFTTTLSGNVWFTCNSIEYPTVDKTVTVFLANAGTYSFTCSILESGSTLTSTAFDVVIAQDDLSFLDEGVWKLLTGGQGHDKTWVLDIDADGVVTDLWNAPVAYSGKDGDPYFYWDYIPTDTTDVSYLNWSPKYSDNTWLMPAKDYGTMTFHANSQTVTTVRPNELITSETGSVAIDLETMLMTLSGTTILRDSGRMTDVEDWQNFRIYKISENAMSLGVKRVLDGGNPGPWVVLYNFISKDYKDAYIPPPPVELVEPIKTSFTQTDLVGTWKYDAIAQDWIGWENSDRLNTWTTREEMITTLTSWGGKADSIFTAGDAKEFVFNGDGSCTLAGIANTYSVTNGVITFGTALTEEFALVFINPVGTTVNVLDVKSGVGFDTGIWIGNRNGTKHESQAVHLMKQ